MTDAPMIVKVRPLVWEEAYDSHPWGWKARCAIMGGFYYADNDAEKREQDDLRAARILAALDLTPDPRVTALVQALEFYADPTIDGYDVEITDYGLSRKEGRIIQDGGDKARAALAAFKGDAQ